MRIQTIPISLLLIIGVVLLCFVSTDAAAQQEKLYGVYDGDWGLKYYMKGDALYDTNWELQHYIRDNVLYDKNWQRRGTIKGSEIYDDHQYLRYRIKEYKPPGRTGP
jgi:hypothetical protein